MTSRVALFLCLAVASANSSNSDGCFVAPSYGDVQLKEDLVLIYMGPDGRARYARGGKKKGLVHTVCACAKKSWNSETSGHVRSLLDTFCHLVGVVSL